MSKLLFTATIPGRCMVKKNSKRIYGSGKNKQVVYSSVYQKWASVARVYLLHAKRDQITLGQPIDTEVEVHFRFYLANRMVEPDTSNLVEGPQDLLVEVGILKDDRLVRKIIAEKHFAKEAKTEIEIRGFE